MKGKTKQESIRPAAYDNNVSSQTGIMQRLSGGGHLYIQATTALTAACSVQGAMLPMQMAQAQTLPDDASSLTLNSETSQPEDTIIVNNGGQLTVNSGGTASNTTVNSGGKLTVSGGTLINTIINEAPWVSGQGYKINIYGGTLTSTTINSGGDVYANISGTNSGTLTSTTINSGGLLVVSGGTLNGVNLSGGTLTFYGCTISGTIQGYGNLSRITSSTGGILIVSGGNVIMDSAYKYKPDTVNIGDNLRISGHKASLGAKEIIINTVDASTPVIKFTSAGKTGGIIDFDKLNVTNFNAGTATSGTLIAVDNKINNNSGAALTSGTTSATLTAANPSCSFFTGAATPYTPNEAPALTLMEANATTFTLVNNGTTETPKLNRLDYSIAPQISQANFNGTVAWNPGGTYYTNSGSAIPDTASLDLTNLKLDFTSATTAKSLSSGTTMTLIGGGNTSGTITQPMTAYSATYTGNNGSYTATLSGEASLTESNLVYTLSGAEVTAMNLTSAGGTADTLPTGWKAGSTPITVDTSSLDTPTNLAAGETKDLFTLEGAAYNLTGSKVFSTASTLLREKVSGMTIEGTQNGGGVRVKEGSTSTLQYVAPSGQASQIAFGEVAWKTSGALLDHKTTLNNVDFTKAKISTENIAFTGIESLNTGDSMTLIAAFGSTSDTITGNAFTLGTKAGEGHAYLENNNLLYLITQGTSQNSSGNDSGNTSQDDAIKKSGTFKDQTIEGDVSGGTAKNNGVAQNNIAAVTGSKVTKDVYGATSVKGAATENTAQVTDSKVSGNVYGTYSDSGKAIGNTATVSNSTVSGEVAGAYSKNGTVSNGNTATVTNTNVSGNVYGGKSDSGEVNLSTATVTGGSVNGNIYGGFTASGNTETNTVEVKDAATVVNGYIYGGKSLSGASNHNTAHIDNATIVGVIGGGCDEATGNTANFAAGTATNNIYGANATTTATNNTANITGGTVQGSVYGAYAGQTVTGNTVNLSGGTVLGNQVTDTELGLDLAGGIYGGYVGSASGTVNNNTVNLYGTANISSASLYGANLASGTGNVLNIGYADTATNTYTPWTGGSQQVADIANFNAINFQTVNWSTSTPAVTITNGTNSDLSTAKVSAAQVYFTGETELATGSQMTLLNESTVAAGKQVQAENLNTASAYTQGTGIQGTGTLSLDSQDNVIYTVDSVGVSEQTHNVLMGQTAVMSALTVSNDYMEDVIEGLAVPQNAGKEGFAVYANMGGGTMRQHTGSHIQTNGWNGVLGLGTKRDLPQGSSIEYGAFVEHGYTKYSTHNGNNYGNGNMNHTGGGILGKWTAANDFYVEGSVKTGRVKDTSSSFLRDALGNTYGYSARSEYQGAHLGIGKVFKCHEDAQLDVYGKYFYTLKKGTSFDAGGHYNLDDVKSSLMRIGARYTKHGQGFDYYAGLAYEHEFDGKAAGTYNGLAIRSADIKGGSARLELGAKLAPAENSPWKLDLNLTGYAGQKRGLAGSISAAFLF